MELKNKIIVITGASSGIGAVLAGAFARRGAVPVLLARSESKLKETAAAIPGECAWYAADVTSMEQVSQAMEAVAGKYGRIDVLVNNAGFGRFETFADSPIERFQQLMDVNYMGTVRCTKAVLPYMLEAGAGHIVNVASMAGKVGTAKSTGYSASKHAVLGLTNSLRQELRGAGVRVSAVNPGPVDTPFFETADPGGDYVGRIGWFMITPQRVADEVVRIVEKGKAEKDLPFVAGLGAKLFQLFPRTFERLTYRLLNKK